ncbi:MAG: AAA family ATPase [Armatimonadetes bacterium CG_4_9_14_3_um_filter_66_14]|nr:MAG: AAA family ATPase [Armatimonadetes bacterium CG_4_9_14_3_um_filter_66_14]
MATERKAALRVVEALPKDVGRAIARLDPEDMRTLGVDVGQVVSITGKRRTVAKVMPIYMEDRGKNQVQVDGITRENAQTALGERVAVEPAEAAPARSLTLAPTSATSFRRDREAAYLRRLLEGVATVAGDRVRATLIGSRAQDFIVVETQPSTSSNTGAVLIQSGTALNVQSKEGPKQGTRITYEDIGGLHKEVQRLREMIELPLQHPEVFERLGIDPPKGVLLHGPPGSGKTLIARSIANETAAYFIHVAGPEIIHKFYGESEAQLRKIFDDARSHAPAIIFLDEIDAIAPKRAEVHGDVEKRVVAQLLALMDGLEARGNVIVIGATNLPNVLDPALRRPGRFDREISIPIPDRRGRQQILDIHTRGMPLTEDVDLPRLAEVTHGFVGADLEALCREAAMRALRSVMRTGDLDFASDFIPDETLLALEVQMEDFREALLEIEPSAIREVFTEIPNVRWSDVGGLEEVKRRLQEVIELPLHQPALFERAGVMPPKGVLLHGAPGTGKTLLAKAVATESEVNFIAVKGPELLTKYVGESEKAVREVFRKARQTAPCLLFFDEIESLVPTRAAGADSHVSERVISQFLAEMDGIEELRGVVVLGATSRLDLLDPALLRAGRFEVQLELPLPSEPARRAILGVHTGKKPLAPDVDLDQLARDAEGLTGADLESVCRLAALAAIRQFLDAHEGAGSSDPGELMIGAEHFAGTLEQLRRQKGRQIL